MPTHNEDLQGLRFIAAPTDRRAVDDWAYDDEFCHEFLHHVAATHQQPGRAANWRQAIQRYWRDRCSRRELADEFGITVDAIKSRLTLIRKAAEAFKTHGHAGFKSDGYQVPAWSGRVHSGITANDIHRIAIDSDCEAIARAEEYHRLTLLHQVKLFDQRISPQLQNILNQP